MSAAWVPRSLNVALRLLAMGSRFALVFVLAKLLEPAEVGLFGLFLGSVGFSMLMIGGDYYTYSQRELMSLPRGRWSFVLQHQLLATGMLYLALLPVQLLLFTFGLLPSELMLWFFALLVVEHLAQEINRLLVAMQRPLLASWVLFIRMGAWVWGLLPIIWFLPHSRNLETIFFAWLIGGLIAILVGLWGIWREVSPWRSWPLDFAWLKRGFGVGFLFLVATLCFKALTTADRFVVEALNGMDLLGVYVLFMGMAMAIMSFLDAAVFSFLYPRMVSAYRHGDYPMYRRLKKDMLWSTLGISSGLAIVIAVAAPFVLDWIGRSLYAEQMRLLWLLLVVAVIYAAGMIPHYGLYARGSDRSIVAAHISSLVVFTLIVTLLARVAPLEAAAYGLIAAFVWMGGFKLLKYRLHSADLAPRASQPRVLKESTES
ncbi:MAG: lipopolysaccharide biosynthesis protein [Thiohalomonadaceae bacterium]